MINEILKLTSTPTFEEILKEVEDKIGPLSVNAHWAIAHAKYEAMKRKDLVAQTIAKHVRNLAIEKGIDEKAIESIKVTEVSEDDNNMNFKVEITYGVYVEPQNHI
ncbi:hypothetical protein [Runella sp.]|uniref:hypothetical protein n=1 Tax=Runella sp. TaxID=1960881 RepID=UPI003D119B9E